MSKKQEVRFTRPFTDEESNLILMALHRLANSEDPCDNEYRYRATLLRHIFSDPETEIIYPATYFSNTETF